MGRSDAPVRRSFAAAIATISLVSGCSGGTADDVADPGTGSTDFTSASGSTSSTPVEVASTISVTLAPLVTDATSSPEIATTVAPPVVDPDQSGWEPIDPATGRWIAFVSTRTGAAELFAAELGSGEERQLTELGGDVYQPDWSPDGSAIAFQCPSAAEPVDGDKGLGPSDICSVVLATGEIIWVTEDAAADQSPRWSPDGRLLAFTTIDADGVPRVRLSEVTGTGPQVVAEGFSPSWSPDGSELVIVADEGSVLIIDVETGGRRQLVEARNLGAAPVWSPDGSVIAYVCLEEGLSDGPLSPTDICFVAADGSAGRRVSSAGRADWGPAWSPDGASIVFTSSGSFVGRPEVLIAPVEGGAPSRLAPGSSPVWSADGTFLAVIGPDGGIQLVDREGGEPTTIIVDPSAGGVAWAPAGLAAG